jgi:hypothetical protein
MPPKKEVGSVVRFPKESRPPAGRDQTDEEKKLTDAAALASIESFLTPEDREELKKKGGRGRRRTRRRRGRRTTRKY